MKEIKKLTLSRETLKVVSEEQLAKVAGGCDTECWECWTATDSCTKDTYCWGSANPPCPI